MNSRQDAFEIVSIDRVSFWLFWQTTVLVSSAIWSLGGRLDGALPLLGMLAWTSPLAFLFAPRLFLAKAKEAVNQDPLARLLAASWSLLILLTWIGLMNAQGRVETLPGGDIAIRFGATYEWLPSAFVFERCKDHTLFFTGVLVQCGMLALWLRERSEIRRLLYIFAIQALVAAVVGAGFRLSGSEKILGVFEPVHSGFFASFRYHNHWTAYALLSMGQCLALGLYWRGRSYRVLELQQRRPDMPWWTVLFVLSLTLPMTTARTGVVFLSLFWMGLAFWFAKGLWENHRKRNLTREPRRSPILSLMVAGLGAGSLVFCSVALSQHFLGSEWERSLEQIEQIKAGEYGEVEWARTDSWGDGWRMLQDRPVTGWGLGSHRYLYHLYARDKYRTPTGTVQHIKEFAHNDWMQFMAELGFLGFALWLGAPVAFFWFERHRVLRSNTAKGLIYPIVLIMLMATFEFPLSNPAVFLIFSIQICLALTWARLGSKNRSALDKGSPQ